MAAPVSTPYVSPWMNDELAMFHESARFIEAEMVPNDDGCRKQRHVRHAIWRKE